MKKLADYINNQYISLKGLDEEIIEKLSNLEGQQINECCGCCPCGDYPCGCDEPCNTCGCDVPCEAPAPAPIQVDPITRCKEKFFGQPKVYDLIDTHTALDYRCRFLDVIQNAFSEPIFFTDYSAPVFGYNRSKKLRDDILTICADFDLLWPVLIIRNNGDIQLFVAKKFGSNGKEGSIKSSLIEAANTLTQLEKRKEIQWAQVLDVSIDNLDDLYDFLFTVTFNKEKYDKELEEQREKDMKKAEKAGAIPTVPPVAPVEVAPVEID